MSLNWKKMAKTPKTYTLKFFEAYAQNFKLRFNDNRANFVPK